MQKQKIVRPTTVTNFYLPANKKKYNYTLGSLVPGKVVYWESGDAWK